MIPIKPIRQKPSHCGPACLEMVLSYYGKKITQQQIAKHAGTTHAQGTPPHSLVKEAQRHGCIANYIQEGTHAQLHRWVMRERIPVIVDWFSVDDGHYSVCVHLTKKNIWLADPEYGKIRRMDWNTFYRNWFDFTGNYLRKKNDIRLRGMIIIRPF